MKPATSNVGKSGTGAPPVGCGTDCGSGMGASPMDMDGSASGNQAIPSAAHGQGARATPAPSTAHGQGARATPAPSAAHGQGARATPAPSAAHGQGARATPAPSTAHGQGAHATNPIIKRQGAYLPHWTKEGASYAVNFRLGDSLPKHVLEGWRRERAALERALEVRGELSEVEQRRLADLYADKVERYLDAGHGACWMKQAPVAELIAGILKHFDGERYRLIAWCVMPNHVHVVFTPISGHDLPDIVGGWKSLSAKRSNALLGRTGTFWQTESYDHLIRDAGDMAHAIKYTLENPEEAGLKNWPWRGSGAGAPPVCMDGSSLSTPSTAHGRGAHATFPS